MRRFWSSASSSVDRCAEHAFRNPIINGTIDLFTLFRVRACGAPQRAGARRGNGTSDATLVALDCSTLWRVVRRGRQVYQCRVDVEHERCVDFASVNGLLGSRFGDTQRGCKDIDGSHGRAASAEGAQRFLVRILAMGGNNDELVYSSGFPGTDEVVQEPMQRFAAHRGASRVLDFRRRVDPIFDGRGAKDLHLAGKIVGQALDDERVTTKRKVRAMLLCRTNGNDEPGVSREVQLDGVGSEAFEVE